MVSEQGETPSARAKRAPPVSLAACLELEAHRQLRLARITDALTNEPIEVKQWRAAATDRIDVVLVVEQVEHFNLRDDLVPLTKLKWPCRPKIKSKVAIVLTKEIPAAIYV